MRGTARSIVCATLFLTPVVRDFPRSVQPLRGGEALPGPIECDRAHTTPYNPAVAPPRSRAKLFALIGLTVFVIVIAILCWTPRGFLFAHYNAYSLKVARDELGLSNLLEYSGPCSERPLSVWAPAAAADTYVMDPGGRPRPEMALDCLARQHPAGAARAYLEALAVAPPTDYSRVRRGRGVALLLALGESAVEDVCQVAQGPPSPEVAAVALRALALLATRRSTACFLEVTYHGDPAIRAVAAECLKVLALGGRVGAGRALSTASRLAQDADPVVRAAAARSFALFDERNARKALELLIQDPDPSVQQTASDTLQSLESLRKIEELQQLGR